MKEKVREKQEAYNALLSNIIKEEKEVHKISYKVGKREVKKAISIAKNNTCDILYHRLGLRKERMRFIS